MAVVKAVHDHEGEVTGVVQRTQLRSVSEGDIEQGATLLLGIEGLDVLEVALRRGEDLEQDAGRVVHLGTGDEGAAACPSCGVVSTSPKGRATTRPRDLPYGDDPVRLVWHKRRWRCRERACERATFTESLPAVPARPRLTTRLRAACGAGVAEGFSCVATAASYHQVSWPIAHAAFVAHVTDTLAQPLPAVEVLGIDETRRGRPRWAQDPDTLRWSIVHDRWHTAIVDAASTAGLLAHVDGRTAAAVADWVAAQPDSWKQAVTHECIDLSASYARPSTTPSRTPSSWPTDFTSSSSGTT
jgi:transposase